MIYLDNSATTMMDKDAAQVALHYMCKDYYNPAASYSLSASVEKEVEKARAVIASALGAGSEEILFTSGGTESNNMAAYGVLRKWKGRGKVITTAVEHPSVLETLKSAAQEYQKELIILPVDEKGNPDLEVLEASLDDSVALVSMMHVNNELGTVTNIKSVSALVRRKAPYASWHADGVQGFLKCAACASDLDFYSASAHKFHGPKGVGILYARKGVPFSGGQLGGGQERNLRSGTLNVPGIMATAEAVKIYMNDHDTVLKHIRACKERLYRNLQLLPDVVLNGPQIEDGAPHILNMSFLGVRSAVLINALSALGTCVSAGSACSSHKKNGNRVLNACGIIGSRQEGAVRFSFGRFNTEQEMDVAAEQIEKQIAFLRKYRRR